MKKMLLTLALLPALARSAAAQDVPWKELALGERVEVTFHSGGTIIGKLVSSNPKITTVDYTKEPSITLDMSSEYAGVDGTMTVSKKEIKSVRKVRVERKPISESVPPKAKPADAEPKPEKPKPAAPAPAVEPKPETDEERDARLKREEEERLKAEELQKAKEFYAKFPSPYWGPERSTMIFQKKARGQALSAAESEFDKDYAKLWKKGQEASAPKSEPKKD